MTSARGGLVEDGWLHGDSGLPWPAVANRHAPGFWIRSGTTRLYGLPALAGTWITAGVARSGWGPGLVLWGRSSVLGTEPVQESTMSVGVVLGQEARITLGWVRRSLRVGGQALEASSGLRVGLGGSIPVGGRHLDLGLTTNWAIAGTGPWARAHPLARVHLLESPFSVLVEGRMPATGTPAISLEGALAMGPNLVLGCRYDGATGTVGPIVWVRRGLLIVTSSHLVHPILGVTNRVMIGWGAEPLWGGD